MSSLLLRNIKISGRRRDLLVEGNRIARIAPRIPAPAGRILDGRGMAALPSLCNSHTHAAMTLLRGYADDMPLMEWLQTKIWPFEACMTEDDVYVGARLGCLEMIRSGTTLFNDMYWHWRGTARAVEEMGLRAVLSPVFIDAGGLGQRQAMEADFLALLEESRQHSDRIRFAIGPHAIYTVSSEALLWLKDLARRHHLLIHIHLSETEQEVAECVAKHGMRPAEYLESLGFLGPEVIAAHGVWLSDHEIEILAHRHVTIVHNPISNLKLAINGMLRYKDLRRHHVTILLGTDGCSSNNSHDMFETVKFAALLEKFHTGDPTCLPAREAWAMVTRKSAETFGVDAGILEEGRLADLILVDTSRPEFTPGYHLTSDLVYATNGYCVNTTLCDGKILMHDRRIPGEAEILRQARNTAKAVLARLKKNEAKA